MIKLINLTRYYGTNAAVKDLNLSVPPGELFGFLGPNGAGKTTTIRMIVGLLTPSEGTVLVNDHDVRTDTLAVKRSIGYLAQNPYLYDKLSGLEFLRFVGGIYGLSDEETDKRAAELLRLVNLDDRTNNLIESYSGGMRQKVGFCAALLNHPKVLILDEPFSGLDPHGARRIKDHMRDLTSQGVTIFMSTHILEIAERVCDRVGVLNHGQLVVEGTLEDLHQLSKSPTGASLEELFIQLTGGTQVSEITRLLE